MTSAPNLAEAEANLETEHAKLRELQGRKARLERTIQDAHSRLAESQERHEGRLDAAARALIDGGPDGERIVEAVRSELREARTELPVVLRAIELQRQAVDEAQAVANRERRAAAAPAIEKAAQRLGDALIEVGTAADGLHDRFESLRQLNTNPDPSVSLTAIRHTIVDNRLNALLDELERDFDVSVKRTARDRVLQAREQATIAEMKRMAQEGGRTEAGPGGVFHWRRGKRIPAGAPA